MADSETSERTRDVNRRVAMRLLIGSGAWCTNTPEYHQGDEELRKCDEDSVSYLPRGISIQGLSKVVTGDRSRQGVDPIHPWNSD